MLAPFSEAATRLPLGIYEHYKGNRYEVLGVGRHSETHEEMVIYRGLYGSNDYWIRPLNSFLETVDWEGEVIPRFKRV
jgi:cyclomaltodextrinase / maltogenic alpha-amylase / neopullulanase